MLCSADALYGLPGEDPGGLPEPAGSAPRLRWIRLMAAGGGAQVRAAGLGEAALARITFTNSAGVHGPALAEFALFGVLAGAKRLPRLQADQRDRVWGGRLFMGQLRRQTVLVLGLGGVGARVAALLDTAGARVIGASRRGIRRPPGVTESVGPDALAETISRVDAVVITLPGTEATEGLVDADVLGRARPGLTLVNVGRGSVVDEVALVDALAAGRVGFAALDVTAVEPLPEDSPLWSLPNVLISPHTATADDTEDEQIAALFAGKATRLIDGVPLHNVVDPVQFY
ncbi:D-2-hydroxyacid dehydrogenase [Pseudonocardia nematodicida]|uniref:D-2-hydroxyacid dehydrogenase n=1 Tax=Pseudonocardia nematodicida TaxID=1206997 RepID=A0ABV1KE41_9PSEU